MPYIENPKTKGSGIVCCIPQKGRCPNGCADCFFQSGRSYLEPLEENTPNMPSLNKVAGRVVRVNDGNDSNNERKHVLWQTRFYEHRFYNTSCPDDLEGYGAPVVLTVNPGGMTDHGFALPPVEGKPIPRNLMFVRVRVNSWNMNVVDHAVDLWTDQSVAVVLTFMAYHENVQPEYRPSYVWRGRTLNSYWAITHTAWRNVMAHYHDNPLVHSCGTEGVSTACRHCGNCLREYWATVERMRGEK